MNRSIKQYEEQMIVCGDTGFDAKEGAPLNFKVCQRGSWNRRMMVETVLWKLTLCHHFKRVMNREWASFEMRLA